MLKYNELKQLHDSIKCMHGYNLHGHLHVNQNNVLILINNYVDKSEARCMEKIEEIKKKFNVDDDHILKLLEQIEDKKGTNNES